MPTLTLRPMFSALAAVLLVSACSGVGTTTEGLSTTVDGITNSTSSTTDMAKGTGSKTAFVRTRFDAIAYDAARGAGENIDTLAHLLGESDRVGFAHWAQQHYGQLFTGLTQPEELLGRIQQLRDAG